MKIFDAHNHFFTISKEYYSDFLNFSVSRGLSAAFINSELSDEACFSSFSSSSEAEKNKIPHILYFTALHPWKTESIEEWKKKEKKILEKIIKNNKSIFIGETGLDRSRGADIETQKEIFSSHIKIALEQDRPFTIHCVREWGNCIEILRSFFSDKKKKRVPFIVHAFSGSSETMKELLKLGGYISFSVSAILNGNKKTDANIAEADLNRFLIETDFPYSSIDKKGSMADFKNGTDAGKFYIDMLEKGYFKTAEILNISLNELSRIIEKNGKIFTDYSASG